MSWIDLGQMLCFASQITPVKKVYD
jgi:hypothetical protein